MLSRSANAWHLLPKEHQRQHAVQVIGGMQKCRERRSGCDVQPRGRGVSVKTTSSEHFYREDPILGFAGTAVTAKPGPIFIVNLKTPIKAVPSWVEIL